MTPELEAAIRAGCKSDEGLSPHACIYPKCCTPGLDHIWACKYAEDRMQAFASHLRDYPTEKQIEAMTKASWDEKCQPKLTTLLDEARAAIRAYWDSILGGVNRD